MCDQALSKWFTYLPAHVCLGFDHVTYLPEHVCSGFDHVPSGRHIKTTGPVAKYPPVHLYSVVLPIRFDPPTIFALTISGGGGQPVRVKMVYQHPHTEKNRNPNSILLKSMSNRNRPDRNLVRSITVWYRFRKNVFWHLRPTKTQIRLRIRTVWSASSLFTWRNFACISI